MGEKATLYVWIRVERKSKEEGRGEKEREKIS